MKLQKPLFALLSLLLLMSLVMVSCQGKSELSLLNDSISIDDSFKKSNGELCKLKTTVVVAYPNEYKDKDNTQHLKKLFNATLLNSPDSDGDIKKALTAFAKSIMSQNSTSDAESGNEANEEDFDQVDIDNFELNVRVSNVYNDNDLLTFCREETELPVISLPDRCVGSQGQRAGEDMSPVVVNMLSDQIHPSGREKDPAVAPAVHAVKGLLQFPDHLCFRHLSPPFISPTPRISGTASVRLPYP